MILETIYFLLPAYFANMAPVIFRKLNFLDYALDFSGSQAVTGSWNPYNSQITSFEMRFHLNSGPYSKDDEAILF